MLKIMNIQTPEDVFDSSGRNVADSFIVFNDSTNPDYLEHYATIMNAAMANAQSFGNPALDKTLSGIKTELYEVNALPNTIPVLSFNADVAGESMPFEVVNGTFQGQDYIYEASPNQEIHLIYFIDKTEKVQVQVILDSLYTLNRVL